MDEFSLNLVDLLYNFEDILKQVTIKNEPGMDVFSDPKGEMRLEFENDEFMLFSRN